MENNNTTEEIRREEHVVIDDTNEGFESTDNDEVQGISIMMEDDNEVEIKEEDIDFPEYYTTTLIGSTEIICIDEEGKVVIKSLEELSNSEENYKIYSINKDTSNLAILDSEFEIIEEENIESTVYKITFANDMTFTCGAGSMILMCNDVWIPVKILETGDYSLGVKYNRAEESTENGVIIPSVLEVVSVEKIENNTEKTYAILSDNCNTLLVKPLNDKEISFIILQQ